MDISLTGVVRLVVYLLVAAGVFFLLFFMVEYVGKEVGEKGAPFIKFAKVLLVVCGVLVLIGILLSFVGVVPPIRFTP